MDQEWQKEDGTYFTGSKIKKTTDTALDGHITLPSYTKVLGRCRYASSPILSDVSRPDAEKHLRSQVINNRYPNVDKCRCDILPKMTKFV